MKSRELTDLLYKDLPCTLIPPKMNPFCYHGISTVTNEMKQKKPGINSYVLNCGFEHTAANRFWACWGAQEDGPEATLLISYSDDFGKSWSEKAFSVPGGETPNGFHVTNRVGTLFCDRDNRLHLFLIQTLGYFDGRSGTWHAVCENPDDENPQWSEPIRICNGTPLNKPCIATDGTWYLPVSLSIRKHMDFSGTQPTEDYMSELDSTRGANVVASTDCGKTWEWRGFQRSTDPLFDEHHVLQCRDGRLKMYARDSFGIVSATSGDGARTWTPFQREWFTASARFFMTALPSGNWLIIRYNTEDRNERKKLTAYLSENDGESWFGGLQLDEREKISYPDGFFTQDGQIFIQYDHLRENGELLMASFREEDVRAGRDVSGKVTLKQITIR